MRNLRQIYDAQIIEVCEGSGTRQDPYIIARYVIVNGELAGKITELED
jgi:hypothetical protein